MPKHMGFEVYVTDENWEPLTEYKVERFDEEKFVTCYIPSSVNQRFNITAKCNNNLDDDLRWTCFIDVDGTSIGKHFCDRRGCEFDAITTSKDEARPLYFANLTLTGMPNAKEEFFNPDYAGFLDDEEACTIGDQLNDLGTIQVSFHRFRPGQGKSERTGQASLESLVVHEKSKKVGCHQIVLGDPIPRIAYPWTAGYYLDTASKPQFKFIFHYRPLDILRAQEIAPRHEVIDLLDPPEHAGGTNSKRSADGDPSDTNSPRKKKRVKKEGQEGSSQREVANVRTQRKKPQDKTREYKKNLNDNDEPKREGPTTSAPAHGKPIVIDLTNE